MTLKQTQEVIAAFSRSHDGVLNTDLLKIVAGIDPEITGWIMAHAASEYGVECSQKNANFGIALLVIGGILARHQVMN